MEQYYWLKFQQQQHNQGNIGRDSSSSSSGAMPYSNHHQQSHHHPNQHHQNHRHNQQPHNNDGSSPGISPAVTYTGGRPNQQYDSSGMPPPFELPPGASRGGGGYHPQQHSAQQQRFYPANETTPPLGPAQPYINGQGQGANQSIHLLQPGPGKKRGGSAPNTIHHPAGHTPPQLPRDHHHHAPSVNMDDANDGGQFNGEETDDRRLSQRRKQLNFGKVTAGYHYYRFSVPTFHRQPANAKHPATPRISMKCSKRRWDTLVAAWRRALHAWDEEPDPEVMRLPNAETLAELGHALSVPLNLYVATTQKELDAVQEDIKQLTDKVSGTEPGGEPATTPGEDTPDTQGEEPGSSSEAEQESTGVGQGGSKAPTALANGGCDIKEGRGPERDTLTNGSDNSTPPLPPVSTRAQHLLAKSPSPVRGTNPELVESLAGHIPHQYPSSGRGESPPSALSQRRQSFGSNYQQYTTPQHNSMGAPGPLDPNQLGHSALHQANQCSPPTPLFNSFIMLRLVHRHLDGEESERIITVSAVEGIDGIYAELSKRYDLSKLYLKAPLGNMRSSGSTNQLAAAGEPQGISPRSSVPKPLATHPGDRKPSSLTGDSCVVPAVVGDSSNKISALGRRQPQLFLEDRENLVFLLRQKFAPTLYYESEEDFAPDDGADYDVQRELEQFTPTRVMFATGQAGPGDPQLVFSSSAAASAYTPNPMATASRLSPGGFFNENTSSPLMVGSAPNGAFGGAMRSREGSVVSPTQQYHMAQQQLYRRSPFQNLEGQQ